MSGRESSGFGPLVSVEWLRERVYGPGDPDLLVVDVQFDLRDAGVGRDNYLERHLPRAVFADLERDLSAPKTGRNGRHPLPSVSAMADTFGRLGVGDETTVVAYDRSGGMFAARLWWMLRTLGHPRVALLDGGLDAWRGMGHEVQGGPVNPRPRIFTPRPRPEFAVAVAEIEANLQTGPESRKHLLLDAREPARWRGETEPFDPVAGRIPGARNHLWKRNLDADGTFLPAAELAREFAPLAQGRNGRRIVCYCGSGLTAAHNALALTLAGLDGVSVYSGSWSEWCADPARPVETGAPDADPPKEGESAG